MEIKIVAWLIFFGFIAATYASGFVIIWWVTRDLQTGRLAEITGGQNVNRIMGYSDRRMSKKYIEADALLEEIEKMKKYDYFAETGNIFILLAHVDVEGAINRQPAADVRENEYSHKVWCPDGSKDLQCAECRAFVDLEDKYCHECGRVLLSEG